MGVIEVLITSLGLAMDSFAVSICKGLSMKKFDIHKALIISFYFSIFHILMPLIGYLLGTTFELFINSIDHWIAFVLLVFIGINMIRESLEKKSKNINDKIDIKTMLPLLIATSIDALAVGITFSFLRVNILLSVLSIGIITFIMSFLGVRIGNKFGNKYEKKAQLFGGIILIIIGLKILIEHLGII